MSNQSRAPQMATGAASMKAMSTGRRKSAAVACGGRRVTAVETGDYLGQEPPTGSVAVTIAAGATPTFSVFATASSAIPFAPAVSRVFVRFTDAAGASHGETSVAVMTE